MPLFNVTHPSYRPNIVKNQVVEQAAPEPNTPRRPTVRTDFGVTPRASAIVSDAPGRLATYDLVGYFSSMRAALVANALSLGAFSSGGLPRYLAAQLPTADEPAPSAAAADAAYANLLVMSYLPPQTAPTAQEFRSLHDSTKREASMSDLAESLNNSGQAIAQTTDNVVNNSKPLIPYAASVPPWGNLLCNQSRFGVQVRTAGGTETVKPTNVPGFVAE